MFKRIRTFFSKRACKRKECEQTLLEWRYKNWRSEDWERYEYQQTQYGEEEAFQDLSRVIIVFLLMILICWLFQ